MCLFDLHDSIKILVCSIFFWSNFNCLARVYFKFRSRSSQIRNKSTLTVHNLRRYWSNNFEIDELHNDWRDSRSNHYERFSEVLDHWVLTQQQMLMHVLVRKMSWSSEEWSRKLFFWHLKRLIRFEWDENFQNEISRWWMIECSIDRSWSMIQIDRFELMQDDK